MNTADKLAVITGGSRGIGRAVADRFIKGNFDLIIGARNAAELDRLREELSTVYSGRKVLTFAADLASGEGCRAFCAFVLGTGRRVDVLVNCAGHFVPGFLTGEPAGTLEGMIASNLFSAYHVTRGLAGEMKRQASGHIFNICSVASVKAYPNGGSYAIAKSGLLGFSRTLREELKEHGIRVTSVLPGATYTRSWSDSGLPEARFMSASDVAEMVFAANALSARSVVEEILMRPQLGDI
jgi:short-subunit dehydrogenase